MNFNIANMQQFDPSKMDLHFKRAIISDNEFACKGTNGMYVMAPRERSRVASFEPNYTISAPTNVCNVYVFNEHSIDVAEKTAIKDVRANPNLKINPVVLNVVGSECTGTNFQKDDEIRDEMINLRTTFCGTTTGYNPYPLKLTDCVYSKYITVMRGKLIKFPKDYLPWTESFRFSLITTTCIKKPKLLKSDMMVSHDFLNTCSAIECVFQTAISFGHPTLILTPFGQNDDDENPIEDIIKIYNFCIFKYGHLFENIIVAVPPFFSRDIFDKFNEGIVRPQDLTIEIDKQYDKKEISENFKKNVKAHENVADENEHDQMQQFTEMFKMMQQNPMMMAMFQQFNNNR